MNSTIQYFQAPKDYFWRWAEDGNVIEWTDGTTICYREDLMELLKILQSNGLPPLGSILLILSLLNLKFRKNKELFSIIEEKFNPRYDFYPKDFKKFQKRVADFEDILNELPKDYLRKNNRNKLIQHFSLKENKKTPPQRSKQILELFSISNFKAPLLNGDNVISPNGIQENIFGIYRFMLIFDSADKIKNFLKTGLQTIPKPLDFTPTENPIQKNIALSNLLTNLQQQKTAPQPTKPILDQLLEDQKTAGIAQLTKRVIAALNIPLHTAGKSDQKLGGISDITNRGEYDKLLLTELANDDSTLTARLVNNEALYFNHESPPPKTQRKRCILVDSTIKMWGLPRVFSMSAALACTFYKQQQVELKAFSLGKSEAQPIQLNTKAGVENALSILDVGLYASGGLSHFLKKNEAQNADCFLITSEDFLHSEDYQKQLTVWQKSLDYLITVSRDGILNFYHLINGRRKLVSTSRYDLKEILFGGKPAPILQKPVRKKESFAETVPFYFPTVGKKLVKNNDSVFFFQGLGVIGIDQFNRLLFYPTKTNGAIEILPEIERGMYRFGADNLKGILYVLVINNASNIKLYSYHILNKSIEIQEFNDLNNSISKAYFHRGSLGYHSFYLSDSGNQFFKLIIHKVHIENSSYSEWKKNLNAGQQFRYKGTRLAIIKPLVNNGYFIPKPKIAISNNKKLLIENCFELTLSPEGNLRFYGSYQQKIQKLTSSFKTQHLQWDKNRHVHKFKSQWNNGATVTFDERGFLTLKGNKPNAPEITIMTIVGKSTACFSSNGDACGAHYFIKDRANYKIISEEAFYKIYIESYIKSILK